MLHPLPPRRPSFLVGSDHALRSPAADIFGLGIMAFELAARVELPQNGEMWQELRQHPKAVVHIPAVPALEQLIHRMMDWQPAARPSAADILTQVRPQPGPLAPESKLSKAALSSLNLPTRSHREPTCCPTRLTRCRWCGCSRRTFAACSARRRRGARASHASFSGRMARRVHPRRGFSSRGPRATQRR